MVSTTNAFRGDIEENVSTSGKVASEEKTVLFAPVSGRLSEINVAAGDAVKAGDVLMTYDMDQMEQRLQEASLQQDKSNASYNSTMTENSKSTAKLNEPIPIWQCWISSLPITRHISRNCRIN